MRIRKKKIEQRKVGSTRSMVNVSGHRVDLPEEPVMLPAALVDAAVEHLELGHTETIEISETSPLVHVFGEHFRLRWIKVFTGIRLPYDGSEIDRNRVMNRGEQIITNRLQGKLSELQQAVQDIELNRDTSVTEGEIEVASADDIFGKDFSDGFELM